MSIKNGHVNLHLGDNLSYAITKQWLKEKEKEPDLKHGSFVKRLIWRGLKK
jgi:hypothetical protein